MKGDRFFLINILDLVRKTVLSMAEIILFTKGK